MTQSNEHPRCILALDLGTTTGWALRSHDGLITSGTASFRPGRYDGGGMRYLRFTNWLTELDRLSAAQRIIEDWRTDYNHTRPHTSLRGLTPSEFATRSRRDRNENRVQL